MAWPYKPTKTKILTMLDLAERKGFTAERDLMRTDGWKVFDPKGERVFYQGDTPLFTTEGAIHFLRGQPDNFRGLKRGGKN